MLWVPYLISAKFTPLEAGLRIQLSWLADLEWVRCSFLTDDGVRATLQQHHQATTHTLHLTAST